MPKIDEIIHGTTLVINAIIERKGAKTALITTRGFRDVLELGREMRYDAYDIFAEYPEPLVPRSLRKEVTERITADGRVIVKLNPEEVNRALDGLCDSGIESLAVCLPDPRIRTNMHHHHKCLCKADYSEIPDQAHCKIRIPRLQGKTLHHAFQRGDYLR
jgi:hypothetical protein